MHKLCWFNTEANLSLVGFDQWHHFTAVQLSIVCNQFLTTPRKVVRMLKSSPSLLLRVARRAVLLSILTNSCHHFPIFTFYACWNIFLEGNIFRLRVWQVAVVPVLWPFFVVSKWAGIKNQDTPHFHFYDNFEKIGEGVRNRNLRSG